MERHFDVAVVGGSAAGLAAALQIIRQRRSVVVVDDGTPRNAPAAHMHGYLGADGAPPSELTDQGREEVRSYGGEILTGRVRTVERRDDGRFSLEVGGGHRLVARRVLAATGMIDELPDIEGLAEHWGRDVIHCPFCHGYEVRDQRVVHLVTHPMGLHPAALLRHLTDHYTIVVHDATGLDAAALDAFAAAGTEVVRTPVRRVVADADGRLRGVELDDGRTLDADAVLVGPKFRTRADVFAGAGLSPTPHVSGLGDTVEVDQMGQTAMAGLYAAGNVTDPTMQVLPAAAHGSRVGAMIAFSLADEDLQAAARPSGDEADWDHRYRGDAPMWSGNPNGTLVHEVGDLPAGRALDVGAGEGGDAIWLAERGWKVTASDISSRALGRIAAEAERRGLDIEYLHRDANAPDAFAPGGYDLVSMQYGSIHRTPDCRARSSLLNAVAPGGTLLVVGHDLTPMRGPIDVATQTRMFDPDAYLGIDEIAAALAAAPEWKVELHETRPRPAGATSTHHVDDVVLRARRLPS
ncbi:MAG: bifunctional NAD(P)/FAD-dependent oxidoreductase/class I SAM-dependent methyltransferase [Actinomycetota bacterium]|nr:bifunctional NAD(P)/FAD-dependent oxidoreductase/class I SAM-dependent methyltransferase [Actinomycetota bacterium]